MIYLVTFPIIPIEGTGECVMKNLKIKMARMELNMSQEELAEKIGATRQTIGLIEAGRYNPSIKLCINICIALHKHLDDLFWDESYDQEEL